MALLKMSTSSPYICPPTEHLMSIPCFLFLHSTYNRGHILYFNDYLFSFYIQTQGLFVCFVHSPLHLFSRPNLWILSKPLQPGPQRETACLREQTPAASSDFVDKVTLWLSLLLGWTSVTTSAFSHVAVFSLLS